MADSATTPDVPVVIDGDVIVEFNEASSRQQINSGESVKTLFGKIRKFLTDFKAVAFSGSYNDLSDTPESLPADGGNADTVDGLHATAFMRYEPDISLTTSINDMITPGTYGVYSVTPDFPTGYGSWGLLEVQAYGSTCHQMIRFESGAIINRAKIVGQTEWTEWRRSCDGGNADTVDGYHASNFYSPNNKPYVTGVVTISGANDTDNLFRIETNHGFAPSWALCCNIADNIVYCCALSSDNPTRFIYLRSTEAIKNGDIFEYIIFR